MLPHRLGFVPSDVFSPGSPGMNPDRPSLKGPVGVPWTIAEQVLHTPEFQVPRGPGVAGPVRLGVVQHVDIVYHHVPCLGDNWTEPVLALAPQVADGISGQRSEAVAARQKEDRILRVGVQRNAQAVDGSPDRIQTDVLMDTDLSPYGRHLYQHVLPGEDRIPPREKDVHNFPHLLPSQESDEVSIFAQRVQELEGSSFPGPYQVLRSGVVVYRPQGKGGQPVNVLCAEDLGEVHEPLPFQFGLPHRFTHIGSLQASAPRAPSRTSGGTVYAYT